MALEAASVAIPQVDTKEDGECYVAAILFKSKLSATTDRRPSSGPDTSALLVASFQHNGRRLPFFGIPPTWLTTNHGFHISEERYNAAREPPEGLDPDWGFGCLPPKLEYRRLRRSIELPSTYPSPDHVIFPGMPKG